MWLPAASKSSAPAAFEVLSAPPVPIAPILSLPYLPQPLPLLPSRVSGPSWPLEPIYAFGPTARLADLLWTLSSSRRCQSNKMIQVGGHNLLIARHYFASKSKLRAEQGPASVPSLVHRGPLPQVAHTSPGLDQMTFRPAQPPEKESLSQNQNPPEIPALIFPRCH